MDVSVVIVNYNTADLLDACLDSVFNQTRCTFEVIVVDNASADESVTMVRSKYPEVVLLANNQNVGFAAANNQGFRIAKGHHVLLLNPDTVVLDGAIDIMFSYLDDNPKTGAVAAKNLNPDMSLQNSCHHFPSLLDRLIMHAQLSHLFPKAQWAGRTNMTYWDYDEIRIVDWATGACLLLNGVALRDVGFFDEDYFLYSEEVDWCFRAHKKKWPVFFLPQARIIHHYGASAQKDGQPLISKNISSYILRSQYIYFRKHHGPLSSLAARCIDFVFGLMLFLKNVPRKNPVIRKAKCRLSKQIMRLACTGGKD